MSVTLRITITRDWMRLFTYRRVLREIADQPSEPWLRGDQPDPIDLAAAALDQFDDRRGPDA